MPKDRDRDDDERRDSQLAIALCDLACAIRDGVEQRRIEFEWTRSHHGFATKHDLDEWGRKIMASQAELIADVKAAIVSLKQTNTDIRDLQSSVDVLKAKIVELEAIVAAGGTISQELVDAVAEVKALAQASDDAIPNAVVVPPPPV